MSKNYYQHHSGSVCIFISGHVSPVMHNLCCTISIHSSDIMQLQGLRAQRSAEGDGAMTKDFGKKWLKLHTMSDHIGRPLYSHIQIVGKNRTKTGDRSL